VSDADLLVKAAERFGTPLYVTDLDRAAGRARAWRDALPGALVAYAVKANPDPALLRRLAIEGFGFEVVGPVELALALRAGGKKVFGTYPYLEAASIGQGGLGAGALGEPQDTVRGFRARRFLGDASAFGNAEVRLRLSSITLILPGTWGINGFGDVGRVWLEGETSDTWHNGVGGGIWISLLNDRMAFSTGFAHSNEADLYYFKGGFSY